MSALLTGLIVNKNYCILVKYLTPCVLLNHLPMNKCTPNHHSKLANPYCLLYSLVKIVKIPEFILVKYLKQRVCLYQCLMTI